MLREFTKSALSFSWAMSLLGAEQAIQIFQPGRQNRENLFAAMTQVAASQLNESTKGFYRTGDSVQGRLVDMAFSWLNPGNWLNPSNLSKITDAGNWPSAGIPAGGLRDLTQMFNPLNWMNPANQTNDGDCGCGQHTHSSEPASSGQQPAAPYAQAQPFTQGASQASTQYGNVPVANESPGLAWGPMPGNFQQR